MSKIIAIATVYDGEQLLAHFVPHYFRLGVDEMHLNVNAHHGSDLIDRVRQAVAPWPVGVNQVDHAFMGEAAKDDDERRILDRCSGDRDWVLHLDIDEFHEYPYLLRTVVAALEAVDRPLISTDMVDRIALDGSFPPVTEGPSIFAQFPLGGTITKSWMGLPFKKVMICRGWVRLWYGRHHATNSGVFGPARGDWAAHRVHHFKWFQGAVERMKFRAAQEWMGGAYRWQCQKMADSVRDNRIEPSMLPDHEFCGEYQYPTE